MHLYGHAYGRHDAVYKRLAEALERLSADAAATAQVCTLKGNKYIVFDCRDGPGPFRITSDVGIEVPIPWTASGRLLLSHMSNGEIRAFIPPEDYRLPDGRVISPDRFLADIATARDRGYCETSGLADRFTLCDPREERYHRAHTLPRPAGRHARAASVRGAGDALRPGPEPVAAGGVAETANIIPTSAHWAMSAMGQKRSSKTAEKGWRAHF
jgi:hypothetical protein